MKKLYQPGILEGVPAVARYGRFKLAETGVDAQGIRQALCRLSPLANGSDAFGGSLDAFEAQMRRMAGQDDGITDAMFRISKPVSGACFWCPPMRDGKLDLRPLGL